MPIFKVTKTFKYTADMEIEAESKAEAEEKAMNISFDDCVNHDDILYDCEAVEIDND